jgi:hypothetical protein
MHSELQAPSAVTALLASIAALLSALQHALCCCLSVAPSIHRALTLALTRILAKLFSYMKQPQVIGEIIGGILMGPSVMGRIPGNRQQQMRVHSNDIPHPTKQAAAEGRYVKDASSSSSRYV